MVLEKIQVTPSEFGEVMGFTGLAADRAGKQAAAFGGNLQVQFMWLFAGLQTLIDQSPRRRHAKSQSQYRIRVHTCAGRDERMVAVQSNQGMTLAQSGALDGMSDRQEKPDIHF